MFGKILLFGSLVFWSVGCARPQYIQKPQGDGISLQSQDSLTTQFANSELMGSVKWILIPTESENGSFILRVFKQDAVDGFPILQDLSDNPKIKLWMPSMNHGSTPVTVNRVGVGTYEVTNVFFIMPGQWEILIKIKTEEYASDAAIKVSI